MLSAEEEFNLAIDWVMRRLKKDSLTVNRPDDEVLFELQSNKETGTPDKDDQYRVLKMLENRGAIYIKNTEYPFPFDSLSGSMSGATPIGYKVQVFQPFFDELFKNKRLIISGEITEVLTSKKTTSYNTIYISDKKGLYKFNGSSENCYPIKGSSYELVKILCTSLQNGHTFKFLMTALKKDAPYISHTIDRINKLCRKKLSISYDLIITAREGVRLNIEKLEIEIEN